MHRFYEPLVLLYVLDRTQGDHLSCSGSESSLEESSIQQLRRKFLIALSYLCDFEKGGDTVTAVFVTSVPLTYYVASNRTPGEPVIGFLSSVLNQLAAIYHQSSERRKLSQREILKEAVNFSKRRLKAYWNLLQASFDRCCNVLGDKTMDNSKCNMCLSLPICTAKVNKLYTLDTLAIKKRLIDESGTLLDLCLCSDSLMKTPEMDRLRERATTSEGYGNRQSPFAEVKHYIGRLACHPRSVRSLISAAVHVPDLFLEPQMTVVPSPRSIVLAPSFRKKLNLEGIATRMISGDENLLQDLKDRLLMLDQAHGIERIVQEEYANKNFKPRVHAELILIEYFYQNRKHLRFFGGDAFIGTSKPSCYCCFLYFRSHPGRFVEPASHQKIYLNWMPPTSTPGVEKPNSELARHELYMLNEMVQSIRRRTIDQIMSQSGQRQKHFDSTTGDTISGRVAPTLRLEGSGTNLHVMQGTSFLLWQFALTY